MSLLNRKGLGRTALMFGLGLSLAACFRPLYGPTASGERLDAVLAAIEVDPLQVPVSQERIAHYLRSELMFDLNGSGQPAPKRYKLQLAFADRIQSPIVDTATGRAQSATLVGDVSYTLLDGDRVVTRGKATASATYDRVSQRFATVRAGRDAEIRLAKELAEQIKTRLAAALTAGV